MKNQKLSQETWFTVLFLFLFFPVGVFLMWKNKKFNTIARILITGFFAIILITSYSNDSDKSDALNSKEITYTEADSGTKDNSETEVNSDTGENKDTPSKAAEESDSGIKEYDGKAYEIIKVDGGDMSGVRQPDVAVDIGYGDREYWGLTNEYGQLIYVIADKIILQDDSTEPVNSDGRYYDDEAAVPGTEQEDLDQGHVIADSLGGVSNAYNITPQDSILNRYGDQAYMEKVIRDAGGATDFIATITYPDTKTQIPSHYHFEYVLRGEKIVDDFDNVNPDEANASLITDTPSDSKEDKQTAASEEAAKVAKIDTNGNGKVTIAEAKKAGYSMPIYSDHWLYKYMDDRDGDGVVGE